MSRGRSIFWTITFFACGIVFGAVMVKDRDLSENIRLKRELHIESIIHKTDNVAWSHYVYKLERGFNTAEE